MQPTISTIPLATLASGDRLALQVYIFKGHQPGRKVYIQSNLHGPEIAGNAVIYELIQFFSALPAEQLQGEIWMVPACNPMATNHRSQHFSSGRFNPYDGKDWNRIFWDYEKAIARDADANGSLDEFVQVHLTQDQKLIQQRYRQRILKAFTALQEKIQASPSVPFREKYRYRLQSLCLDADYVIDLHSSNDQGINYLYYCKDRDDSAKFFLMPVGILLDAYDGDAFDEAFIKPWLALENRFAALGRSLRFDIEAWTLELGSGMQMHADSVAKGVRGVKNYLVQKGLLSLQNYPVESLPYHDTRFTVSSRMTRYYAPTGGYVQSRVALGSAVEAGQVVYELLCLNKEGRVPETIQVVAAAAGLVFNVSTNQAVNEGEYVLGII
ncbi:MAG: succinylglutamate desuccinylase/aspartoacylase family protein [Elainellaceae cyanobacterium]